MSQAGSVTSEAAGSKMLRQIGALLPRPDSVRLEFGIKTALAVLIALAIEFWFALGAVGSAAITVVIVQSNLLGTTFEKSVLRMIGNVIGCSLGLVFLSVFDQDRIAGAIFFTIYSVFCCYHLQRSRFAPGWHWAYDSAGLVFLTRLSSPTGSFTYTAERWLEISLGIAAMAVVGGVLWPARAGNVFERKFTAMLANLAGSIAASRDDLLSKDTSKQHSGPGTLAAGLSALRDALQTASRDTSRYQRFHDSYESLVSGLQSLVIRSTLLADAVSKLNRTTNNPTWKAHCEQVATAFDQLHNSIDMLVEITKRHFRDPGQREHVLDTTALRSTVQRIHSGIKTAGYSFPDASAMLYVCDKVISVADELDRFADELLNVESHSNARSQLSAVQQLDSDSTPFLMRVDVRKSLVCGLIIGLAFVVWIMTNWPSGSLAVFFALLVTSKNCTAPYLPPKAMIPSATAAVFVGAVMYLGVLPQLDGFWQLAVVLFPFYTICGYLMLSASATVRGMAGSIAVYAMMVMSLDQQQSYSWGHVVGLAYAIIGGMLLAFIVLTCVWPIVPAKKFTSQVKGIFNSCGQLLRAIASNTASNSIPRTTLAIASTKQLGLCGLWAKLIDYSRLPPNSRNAVADLTSSIQITIFHLIELDHTRQGWTDTSHSERLKEIAQCLEAQCSESLDGFVRALEKAEPFPELPDTRGVLRNLQDEFDRLRDSGNDDESNVAEARKILAMTGQYTALSTTIAECRDRLCGVDWKTLNQNYF